MSPRKRSWWLLPKLTRDQGNRVVENLCSLAERHEADIVDTGTASWTSPAIDDRDARKSHLPCPKPAILEPIKG
jgi:hypothetical protein